MCVCNALIGTLIQLTISEKLATLLYTYKSPQVQVYLFNTANNTQMEAVGISEVEEILTLRFCVGLDLGRL
jgi:hypothetical protein